MKRISYVHVENIIKRINIGGYMEPIFKRMNLVKSLVPKLSTSFDFESLNAGFDKFRSSVCLTDKFKDDIIMEVYKVYASLSK